MVRRFAGWAIVLTLGLLAGCEVEERAPDARAPDARAPDAGEVVVPAPAEPHPDPAGLPPEHPIEVTNPTDREVTIVAVVDGAEQEIGRVGPNRTARLSIVTQSRTSVHLIARDAYGRTIATGSTEIDGQPARWVIGQ